MIVQYLSPAVMDRLLRQKAEWTGEVRQDTIMFFDIRGGAIPDVRVEQLNRKYGSIMMGTDAEPAAGGSDYPMEELPRRKEKEGVTCIRVQDSLK